MSVYKKLHQLQSALRSLGANAEGQTGAARYNYVSGAKLLGLVRPMMDKLGLLLTQEVMSIDNKAITYTTLKGGEKTEMFTTLQIKFTWIDVDDGSKMENSFFANGMNAWDKGLGSALTYAERYYLMKTFHIATDEDDIDALVREEAVAEVKRTPSKSAHKLLSEEEYSKIVAGEANGRLSKSGKSLFDAWVENCNPTDEEVRKFIYDVDQYKIQTAMLMEGR